MTQDGRKLLVRVSDLPSVAIPFQERKEISVLSILITNPMLAPTPVASTRCVKVLSGCDICPLGYLQKRSAGNTTKACTKFDIVHLSRLDSLHR